MKARPSSKTRAWSIETRRKAFGRPSRELRGDYVHASRVLLFRTRAEARFWLENQKLTFQGRRLSFGMRVVPVTVTVRADK